MKSADKALVVYGPEDSDAVLPLLEALDKRGRLAGPLPRAPELSKRRRDGAREIADRSDVGLFVVSESSIRSPFRRWLLAELSSRKIPVIPLFRSPIRLTDLHSKLKFSTLDWSSSCSVPQRADLDSERFDQLLKVWFRRDLVQSRRRRPPTKSEILEWVGKNAIPSPDPPGEYPRDAADRYVFYRRDPDILSQDAFFKSWLSTLSIAELRKKRIEALSYQIAQLMSEENEQTVGGFGQRDRVDCSVFAPPTISTNQKFKIQALLHLQDDLAKAGVKAKLEDTEAQRLSTQTLQVEVRRGSKVELYLDCPELEIQNSTKFIEWRGEPRAAVWSAVLSGQENTLIRPKLRATVNGIPVGYLEFELQVAPPSDIRGSDLHWRQGRARSFRTAFISYARADFERVSFVVEGIGCTGVELLFDVTSLEPGDDWATWIKEAIPRADVFILMWSNSSADSVWVDRECRFAMHRNALQGTPDITPIVLERPTPWPPEYLRHLHFSSKYLDLRIREQNPLFERPVAGLSEAR